MPWPLDSFAFWAVLVWLPVFSVLGGRARRKIERLRFERERDRHGFNSHAAYVAGKQWKARRAAFLRSLGGRPPCWCCGRPFRRDWPVHHLSYWRAGSGGELARDLRFVCVRCHERFHRAYRPHGRLYQLGFSLRAATHLVRWRCTPARWARRAWHAQTITRHARASSVGIAERSSHSMPRNL